MADLTDTMRAKNERKNLSETYDTTSKIKIVVQPSTSNNPGNLPKKISNISMEESNQSVFLESNSKLVITPTRKREMKTFANNLKVLLLVMVWAICSFAFVSNNEKIHEVHQISLPKHTTKSYLIFKHPSKTTKLGVMLKGAFLPSYYGKLSPDMMNIWVRLIVLKEAPSDVSIRHSDIIWSQNISETWNIPIVTEDLIGHVPEITYRKVFELNFKNIDNSSYHIFEIQMKTNLNTNFPITMSYNMKPINPHSGIIYAGLVLVGLYVLIIFDLVDRTLAAMLASTTSLAILAIFDERPTMKEIISWMDIETLMLLFSMMILVTILSETGIFDYTAVLAFKTTRGKLWPLINILCVLTSILACVFDNVTTALLITPVTIKLCEVMKLNPKQILIYTLIFANIGGAITPIGDPPNVIIASNPSVIKSGVTFGVFTIHMSIGVLLAYIVVYIQIRLTYRDKKYYEFTDPQQVRELKNEIAVLERTEASVSSYSRGEDVVKESLLKQTLRLQHKLKQTVSNVSNTIDEESEGVDHDLTLVELEKKYPIRNKCLLLKSGITLLLVILVFFLHSFPELIRIGLGWTAFLGALLLFLLHDKHDLEGIFARVEWSTLVFFASLFILMEALSRLGLIDLIGTQTQQLITSVSSESRLATAIVLMLWVSTIASAFVDNVPLTTMMIRIAVNLSNNSELHLPLQPLVWALSFGACLGGNGSLFGSSSNIVCAGLADQHGYNFTFMDFLKIGLPVTITSTIMVTIYLIICHVIIGWH